MRRHGPSHYDVQTLLARLFKSRVIDPDTGCWLWVGARTQRGYGKVQFTHRGQSHYMRVHRLVAWMYFGYDGSRDLEVCHSCNVKVCFNPAHLYVGTHLTNMRDAEIDHLVKNRARGERHGKARLTSDQAREIRALYAGGDQTLVGLAKRFGVDACTIGDIVHGRTWKHISEVLQ
jgi:hypothetical protein